MTVTGATTADQAPSSAYTPPFKYVTSYPASPQVTGSVTSALPINPTVTASSDGAFATAYLQAHMMSWPSYRYAYLLWMVLAGLAALYALAHHLRLSGGSFGAGYARWGMRRKPVGSRKQGGARGRALPSNSVLVCVAIIVIVSAVLSVIGSDYITPSSGTLNFASSFRKRASIGYTINKSWWTSASRFGFMAFALMPLVVLFALKAPPVAIFSLRAFTHVYSDKLAVFHRAIAWVVWGFTTIHVALWTVQLFQDSRNGRAVWFYIWNSYRFIFGCVAYGMMTAVMVLSLKPFRKNSYEFFYYAHVVFVFLTIVCSAIHHPVLWFWMAAALILWGAERAFRLLRLAKINGIFGKRKYRLTTLGGTQYQDTQAYGMQDIKRSEVYTDKTLPRAPTQRETTPEPDFGRTSTYGGEGGPGYYDEGSFQQVGSDSTHLPRSDSIATMQPLAREPLASATPPAPVPIPVGYAQAQLLPSRTVRLTINVARPFRWAPGQSILLYLPDLSKFQSHPFTIINNNPNEIVLLIKARKGMTKRLFELVRAKSLAAAGVTARADKRISLASMQTGDGKANKFTAPPIFVKAWVDGPMGSAERVRWGDYSSVLVICGGSGVSFGAAVCEHICNQIKNGGRGRTQRVRFCWVVREYAEIAWVASQLRRCQDLVSSDQLQINIFVTNANKQEQEFAPPRPGFVAHGRRGSADSIASEMSVDSPSTGDHDDTVDGHLSANYADVIDLTNYEDEEDINDPAENQLSQNLQQQGKVRRAKSRKAAKRGQATTGISHSHSHSNLNPNVNAHPNRARQSYDPNPRASYDSRASDAPRGSSAYDPRGSAYDQPRGSAQSYDPRRSAYEYENPAPLDTSNSYAYAGANDSLYAPPSAPMLSSTSSADRRQSYRSLADSTYAAYDPFGGNHYSMGPSPSPSIMFDDNMSTTGESVYNTRELISRTSRTQSMVLLEDGSDPTGDAGLYIDEADHAAMSILSELAKAGKPKLSAVLEEEIEIATGSMIVATCGPVTLNTVVRNLVSKNISPKKIRSGDKSGLIAIYSEDYEA
ncbi:ferric-chelate reductase [Kwoniella heveanensis CBS 569]|nr:ferric-chelate reductase [Kwoniella heveanensis CBS 569]